MEKHLLVAVSEQQSAMHGVRFISHFFSNKDQVKLTLFYTAPRPLESWGEKHDPDAVRQNLQLTAQYEAKGRKAVEAAKRDLIKMGFKEDRVDTKLLVRKISKVMDLVQEGEKGLYDAVVLGRRGLSWLEEAFEDSVSKGLLEKKCNFPLWMCRQSNKDLRNVLVCVDGSEAAYRIADHVGFTLEKERGHEVTLLMVAGKREKAPERAEKVFSKTIKRITSSGFPDDMIKTKWVSSRNTAEAILKEAEEGRFAAVALGRRSAEQGFLQRIFTGSVSSKIFRELEGAALWVCH